MSDTGTSYRRRVCLAVDIQGYSPRSGPWHGDAQKALADALDLAATRAGLDRGAWWRQQTGDGERAVLPGDSDEAAVVGRFPIALGATLHETDPRSDVRVRLALHHGITYPAALGDAGEGLIEVCRIVDTEPLRTALAAAPEANLALALSEVMFRAVHKGYSGLDPAAFRRAVVRAKEFHAPVWILVPDADPARRPLDADPPAEAERGDGAVQQTATGHTVLQASRDMSIGSFTQVDGDLRAHFRIPRGPRG